MPKKTKRFLYTAAGLLALAAGLIGIFIPVWPTTPFLLLASFCFLRGSEKLHDWLINHKVFGAYIRDYTEHRAVRKKAKIGTLVFLWASLILSIILVKPLYVDLILVAVGIAVSIHILTLKTL